MTRFERLKQILDEAVEGHDFGAHGAFWRPLNLEQFKQKKIYGRRLVVPGDVISSNLVLALRGRAPFGSDIGTPDATYPRMPVGFQPLTEDRIVFIEEWILSGCPDDQWVP
jgi:hypothetical protein